METIEELSDRWWQHITKEEADNAMKKYGIYGHDQGADVRDVIGMWTEAGSPIIEEETFKPTLRDESIASIKAMLDYATNTKFILENVGGVDVDVFEVTEEWEYWNEVVEDLNRELVFRIKQIFP